MKKSKNLILSAVCLLLLVGIGMGLYSFGKKESLNENENAGKTVTATDDTSFVTAANTKQAIREKVKESGVTGEVASDDILKGISNILLIGADNDNLAGMGRLGNADGIMLVTVNNNLKQVTFTSFMRDTKIRQPREYEKKMTSIYHVGGAKLLIEAIEQNFGVYIDQYILVNYLNVIDIVDFLGGLDIELSAEETNYMNDKINNLNELTGAEKGENLLWAALAGRSHLNGVQTAAYLRIRPGSTDYDRGRTERARNVVLQILAKLDALSTAEKSAFSEKIMPEIETDMTDSDILSLTKYSETLMDYGMYSATIPLENAYKSSNDGNAFVIPDLEVNSKYLYESLYEGKH